MTIYMTEQFHPDAMKRLHELATVVNTLDHPEEIDGIMIRAGGVSRELMDQCPNLKAVGRHGAGYDTVDLKAAKEKGITVVNVPSGNSDSVAELIVGLALNLERRISEANAVCRAEGYPTIAPASCQGTELKGKTFGSIGMGNIASRAAKIMANGFGMTVLGYDRHSTPEQAREKGFEKVETVEELLRRSDVVNISVPLNAGTKDMISGAMFDCFKPGAILINCARGGVVNEDDLYDALVSGKLKAAACDAFVKEPVTKENKLLSLPNFSATPHIGGNTEDAIRRTGLELVENVVHVIKGEPASGVVKL